MPLAIHATRADLDSALHALAAAFADDPVQRWLFEPAADPIAGITDLFRILVEDYFWLGHLHVVTGATGIAGAALWAPPDRDAVRDDARLADLLAALTPHLGDDVGRITELAKAHEYRPAEPHFYLGILGVDPHAQSSGLGTALLAPGLAECDRTGTLAHLESSNPRNIPFYLRHGFTVVDEYRCGGDGALMTIMTRQPR